MPFAFMFTVSSGDAAEHAKTRILRDVLKFINARCPNIMFTLSDKDQAEITACQAEIAKAKYQLCYWHGIKYVEERLAENKLPAAYDPQKVHRVFDFIDPTWAPGVTAVYANEDEDGEGLSEDEDEQAGTQMPVRYLMCRFWVTHTCHRNHLKRASLPCSFSSTVMFGPQYGLTLRKQERT